MNDTKRILGGKKRGLQAFKLRGMQMPHFSGSRPATDNFLTASRYWQGPPMSKPETTLETKHNAEINGRAWYVSPGVRHQFNNRYSC